MGLGCTFLSAENQSHRRVFSRLHPMFAGVVEVQGHLPSIGVAELANLEVNYQETLETTVEEKQIDAEPAVVNSQPALTTDKSKVVTQLEEEIGQMLK